MTDPYGDSHTRCFLWTGAAGIRYLGEIPTVNDQGELLSECRWFNPYSPVLGTREKWVDDVAGLNNSGQVIGTGYYVDNWPAEPAVRIAFRWTPPAVEGDTATLDEIRVPEAWGVEAEVRPCAINDAGDVAGMFNVGSSWQVFLYTAEDGYVNLGPRPELWTTPRTQVLGKRFQDGTGQKWIQLLVSSYRPELDAGSRITRYTATIGDVTDSLIVEDLGTLRADDSGYAGAGDMNSIGQIVGAANSGSNRRTYATSAYCYNDVTGMLNLGTLSTDSTYHSSWAHGINDLGEIVGISHFEPSSATRPFVYTEENGMQDLTQITADIPWELLNAKFFPTWRINNAGDIVGPYVTNYNFDGGPCKAFLLRRLSPR